MKNNKKNIIRAFVVIIVIILLVLIAIFSKDKNPSIEKEENIIENSEDINSTSSTNEDIVSDEETIVDEEGKEDYIEIERVTPETKIIDDISVNNNVPKLGVPVVTSFNTYSLKDETFEDFGWGVSGEYLNNYLDSFENFMIENYDASTKSGIVYKNIYIDNELISYCANGGDSGFFNLVRMKGGNDQPIPKNYYMLIYKNDIGEGLITSRNNGWPEKYLNYYSEWLRSTVRNTISFIVPNPIELEEFLYDCAFSENDKGQIVVDEQYLWDDSLSYEENISKAKDFGDYYVILLYKDQDKGPYAQTFFAIIPK